MTSATMGLRTRRPRREAPTHLFAVGQNVRLKSGFGMTSLPTSIYHITGKLPARGDSPQYRIRSDEERHERVVTQDNLTGISHSNASLIERTFGNG